jgi:hypothetical protein
MRGANWRFWGLCACAGVLSILTGCASVTHGFAVPAEFIAEIPARAQAALSQRQHKEACASMPSTGFQ